MATATPTPTPEGTKPTVSTEDRLKQLEADLATERQRSAAVTQVAEKVAAIDQRLTQAMAPPPPPPVKTDEPDFFVDPKAATLATVKPAFDALALGQLQQQAYLWRGEASRQPGKIGYAFRKWGSEIDELTKNDGIMAKANLQYWINAAKIVLGDHAEEIAKSGEQGFLEGASAGVAPGSTGEGKQQRRQLSAAEQKARETFKKMGVDMGEDEYLTAQEEIMAGVHNDRR